jgi:hypothetical protein
MSNNNLVLICGKSASGKSLSLRNIKDPSGVIYLNCENNKSLPFNSGFKELTITDPMEVYQAFIEAEAMPDVHTIVVDSLTYMMDMYESLYVLTAINGMKAWGDYAQFFKKLMSQYVAVSTKNVIFTAHTMDVINNDDVFETLVKVKGSLMNTGIESYFSTVVSSKKVRTKELEKYDSNLLTLSDREKRMKVKYCFQTLLTEKTVDERMRSSFGMWDEDETYIDNDVQTVLDRLHDYYK